MKNRQTPRELQAAMASLAARDADARPPDDLEGRLMAQFTKAPETPTACPLLRTPRFPVWAAVALTSAAAILLVPHRSSPPTAIAAEAPFVQVPFVAPPAPYERVELVREVVPIAALIAAGFEVHVDDCEDTAHVTAVEGAQRLADDLDGLL